MTKELYINGQLCDLEDTPSLIFQSPVFNDLDVIQSNRSAEINLPLTPRNRKAFGLIDRIDILDDSHTGSIRQRTTSAAFRSSRGGMRWLRT